jgi:hypothetical protein
MRGGRFFAFALEVLRGVLPAAVGVIAGLLLPTLSRVACELNIQPALT